MKKSLQAYFMLAYISECFDSEWLKLIPQSVETWRWKGLKEDSRYCLWKNMPTTFWILQNLPYLLESCQEASLTDCWKWLVVVRLLNSFSRHLKKSEEILSLYVSELFGVPSFYSFFFHCSWRSEWISREKNRWNQENDTSIEFKHRKYLKISAIADWRWKQFWAFFLPWTSFNESQRNHPQNMRNQVLFPFQEFV